MTKYLAAALTLLLLALPAAKIAFTSPAHAREGGTGEGGENPKTKDIVLDKTVYEAKDLTDAVKQVDAKNTVTIKGTSGYKDTSNFYGRYIIKLSRYVPDFAAKLLNKWLGLKSFTAKHKAVKKARKNLEFLIRLVDRKKDPVRWKMLENAHRVAVGFEQSVKRDARSERKDKNKSAN